MLFTPNETRLYEGAFKKNVYDGDGTLFNSKEEVVFSGKFSKGIPVEGSLIPVEDSEQVKPKGKVLIYSSTDEKIKKYEGEVNGNAFEGKGILYFEDLNNTIKYQGDFKNSLFDGVGTLYDISKAVLYKGYFKEGKASAEIYIGKSSAELKAVLGEPDKPSKKSQENSADAPSSMSTVEDLSSTATGSSIFNYDELGLRFILSKDNDVHTPKVTSVIISSIVDIFDVNINMDKNNIQKKLGPPASVVESIDPLSNQKSNSWIYYKDSYIFTLYFADSASNILAIEISKNPSILSGGGK